MKTPATLLPDADPELLAEWQKHALPIVIPIDLARAKWDAKERARVDKAIMDRAKHLTTKEGTKTK